MDMFLDSCNDDFWNLILMLMSSSDLVLGDFKTVYHWNVSDFQRKDQRCLPNHSCFDAEYEKMIEDTVSRQSNQTRCYMCGNCARESHKCWANVEDGLTIRYFRHITDTC